MIRESYHTGIGNQSIIGNQSNKMPRRATKQELIDFSCRVYIIYRVYKKKLNKPEIAHRLCKTLQCTKFFIEIGCLGTDNVV